MKAYRQRIQEYRDFVQQTCIREEAGACTIKVCQDILTEQALQMESKKTSYFEFLYEQSRFIKKRWWVLQGGVLLYLWLWLSNNANDMKETMRLMGIFATMFVILIVPEVWKNRRNGAVEVEQASYYTPDLCGESPVVCSSGLLDCHDIFGGSISDNGTYPEQSGCELLTSGQCVLLHLLPRVV